jgi:glyoxylase-like metal-dependent hydrolase (beta-lactamase superfamily II)
VVEFLPDFQFVDGQSIRQGPWEIVAVHTPGHSPGHLCFYERTTDTLFSGDHILPHINTSPGFRPHASANPVQDYLATLDRLETLDVARVLPGHQRPFTHFAQRVQRLREHHARRLALTHRLVGEGRRTVWQVSSELARSRPWESLTDDAKISAMGETYGHLLQLVSGGRLRMSAGPAIHWTAA